MPFLRFRIPVFPGAAAVILLLCGCSTMVNSHKQKEGMMAAYIAGDRNTVSAVLDDKLADSAFSAVNTGDELMWRLEAGTWKFLLGDDAGCFAQFTKAEELMADYDRRALISLRQAAAEGSMLLINPNTLPYRGLCRDRVLFPVYKALACLGQKNEAGFRTELFHLREIQDRVISDYRKYFQEESRALRQEQKRNPDVPGTDQVLTLAQNRETAAAVSAAAQTAGRGYGTFLNPFTVFLSGYGYLRDGDYENALVDFQRLRKALPDHPLVNQCCAALLRRTGRPLPPELAAVPAPDFSPDRNHVLIIFAHGRSAAFNQLSLFIPVYYAHGFKLIATAWPVCELYAANFTALQIQAGDRTLLTRTIADMDAVLAQEYQDRLPAMLTRLILSTAAKEAATYALTEAAGRNNRDDRIAAELLTSLYKAAVNTADTRSWELLPKEYQLAMCPVPADRKLVLALPGQMPTTVTLPPEARSAIIFFNAPSAVPQAMCCRVFSFRDK